MNDSVALMARIALFPAWLIGLAAYVALQLLALLIAMPFIVASAIGPASPRPGPGLPADRLLAGLDAGI